MKASKEKLEEAYEAITDLEKLLTERISELHEVKGGQQARHAYCYYRSKVWEAMYILRDIIEK